MRNKHLIGTHIQHAAQPAGTWSGGTTHALFAYPSDSLHAVGSGPVWLGTATVDRSADYSFFPERVRVHVPIKGNGLRLHFAAPDEVVTLPTFAQYRFDGARPVHAELIDGSVVAFNLIMQANVEAVVKILSLGSDVVSLTDQFAYQPDASNDLVMIYAINGSLAITNAGQHIVTLREDEAFVLHPRSISQLESDAVMLQRLEADTAVVVVGLHL